MNAPPHTETSMQPDAGNSPTRVMVVHNILWSHYKAAVFSALGQQCREGGVELLVLQIALVGKGQRHFGAPDQELHRYPYKLLFNRYYEELNMPGIFARVQKEFFEYRPDLVVVPGYEPLSLLIILLARLMGRQVIMAVDSTEADRQRNPLKEAIKKIAVGLCDGFFSYGTRSSAYLRKLGAPEDRIFSDCQAIDNQSLKRICQEVSPNREGLQAQLGWKKRNFVYVGRLAEVKNVETLLQAFASVKQRSTRSNDWGLILVGEGERKEELQEMVRALPVADVFFVGGKSWDEVPKVLALCDVLVLPSRSEPWGLVVNEAMACALPVVVSERCGAADDLVRVGENGFLFDPESPRSLADILQCFVDGEVDAAAMGRRSEEIISRFTSQAAASRMLAGMKAVLS